MKRIIYFLSGLFILASCAQSTDQAAIKSEIEQRNEEFMKAVAAKDADGLGALYSEDARLMFPNMPVIEGRANIKGFFQNVMQSGITGVKLSTEEVSGTDDFAVESGRYAMLAGDKTVDEGKYLVEWKKVDGKWHLHRDMPSTNHPAPQAVAQPGQTVGIAVFKVKKGNSEKFETFVNNVLMPAADSSTPGKAQAVKSVRFMKANAPAKDGTHTYLFMFDPRSDEMEYEIQKVLVAKHGQQKGLQLDKEFGSLVTSHYEYYDMQQLPQAW